jgi:DNA-binding transcriptional LysR family regulator
MHQMNDLRRIDLNLLVILDALLSEQHVTRAAERLHLSQPAVSHALARLRDLLGDPLLVRAGASLVPTSRALELMAPLAEALAQVQSLLAPNAFDPATAKRTFRLAMSDYGAAIVLPGLIRTLRHEAPGIDLQISHCFARHRHVDLGRRTAAICYSVVYLCFGVAQAAGWGSGVGLVE